MIRILYSMNVILVVSYHARYVSGIASMHDVILHKHTLSSSYSASYRSFNPLTGVADFFRHGVVELLKNS